MIKLIKSFIIKTNKINEQLNKVQEAIGRIELRQVSQLSNISVNEAEFKVFSQWGEDGIIQYLISKVKIEKKVFVEFGVENYTESNTRFLLINNNWSGLVIDGSEENIRFIKRDPIFWRYNLKAECAFITRENINKLLQNNGISGDIGILSIDIDGNDYWVWESIECISPRIVICEYNSIFGDIAKVTVPYNSSFVRNKVHFSNIFYGASISALNNLAISKGYSLVGSNSSGNNLFFVRNDLIGDIPVCNEEQAYKKSQFREHRNESGELTFYSFEERLKSIEEKEVYNLETGNVMKIKDIESISKYI